MGSHFFRLALAAIALAVAPSLVCAGPIGWSYTVRTTTGLGVLNLGTWQRQLLVDSFGNGTFQPVSHEYVTTAPLPESRMSGESSLSGWPPSRAERLFDFGVGSGYSIDPVATAPASDAAFLLSFTLTDKASGQAATIDFEGHVVAHVNDESTPSVLFIADFNDPTRSVTLGSSRYQVTAVGGTTGERNYPAMMGVEVLTTANTPEPATLALAGLGLAGVGLFRGGRRAVQDSGR